MTNGQAMRMVQTTLAKTVWRRHRGNAAWTDFGKISGAAPLQFQHRSSRAANTGATKSACSGGLLSAARALFGSSAARTAPPRHDEPVRAFRRSGAPWTCGFRVAPPSITAAESEIGSDHVRRRANPRAVRQGKSRSTTSACRIRNLQRELLEDAAIRRRLQCSGEAGRPCGRSGKSARRRSGPVRAIPAADYNVKTR